MFADVLGVTPSELITGVGDEFAQKNSNANIGAAERKVMLAALIKSIANGETDNVVGRAMEILDATYAALEVETKDSPNALVEAAKMAILTAKHKFEPSD